MTLYRIYFNRKKDAPQVWSVDEGSQESEINVREVRLHGVFAKFVYLGGEPNPDTPVAVCEVLGKLSIEEGVAFIRGDA